MRVYKLLFIDILSKKYLCSRNWRGRNFQFEVLPFALINSVTVFQQILDRVLSPELHQFTAVCVDDIHLTSTTIEEHPKHLLQIFDEKFVFYTIGMANFCGFWLIISGKCLLSGNGHRTPFVSQEDNGPTENGVTTGTGSG